MICFDLARLQSCDLRGGGRCCLSNFKPPSSIILFTLPCVHWFAFPRRLSQVIVTFISPEPGKVHLPVGARESWLNE